MTALALRALAFAERYGVTITVVASDRLRWRRKGRRLAGRLRRSKPLRAN
jgi:hypothetical protein